MYATGHRRASIFYVTLYFRIFTSPTKSDFGEDHHESSRENFHGIANEGGYFVRNLPLVMMTRYTYRSSLVSTPLHDRIVQVFARADEWHRSRFENHSARGVWRSAFVTRDELPRR